MAEMFWAILPADMADMAIAMVGRNWQIFKRLRGETSSLDAGYTFTKEQGLLYEYPGIRSPREPPLRPFSGMSAKYICQYLPVQARWQNGNCHWQNGSGRMATFCRVHYGAVHLNASTFMEVQAQGTSIEPLSHDTIVSEPSHTWPKFKDADPYRQWYDII
ncbi:hypothetical protein BD310DRAFT_909577 [Dichomitus squalens]|uniref:Uncharacterized protein n=1 Tax=Dichomitus squalens TaxID=114155 RepID=A0A4Q9PEF6_9APHY|nr:hypothetical protein BD310DRAFT_909577 [Dichomitus squalens]